jgi:hypothetical protein
MATTDKMIAMADARGPSPDASGTAIATGGGGGGGVGMLPAIGLVGAGGGLVAVAANTGDSGSAPPASRSDQPVPPSPSPPEEWSSWTDPKAPFPYQDVTVWVDVNAEGVTVEYAVSGDPNQYQASGSRISALDGTISFMIPGDEVTTVTYTIMVSVPEWGTSYVRTFEYFFKEDG